MKKRYCKLSTYNRLLALKEIRKQLAKMGATVLIPGYYELYEMETYTNEDNAEKVAKLKKDCKNIIVLRGDYGEGLQLQFILNGFYYYISYDENPFMAIMYQKIKIEKDGSYKGARYLYSSDDLNDKSWKERQELCFSLGYDNLFRICNDEEIKEIATYHLEQIKKELIQKGKEAQTYSDHYHPRGAAYNIFEDVHHMNRYASRPMTEKELNL